MDTQTNAGDGPAPGLRDNVLAFLAMRQALALRQPAPGQLNRVFHAGIYLFLYIPVTGPANRHSVLLNEILTCTCRSTPSLLITSLLFKRYGFDAGEEKFHGLVRIQVPG
jgi:hypothetical protein